MLPVPSPVSVGLVAPDDSQQPMDLKAEHDQSKQYKRKEVTDIGKEKQQMANRLKRLHKAVSLLQAYLQPSRATHNELPFASLVCRIYYSLWAIMTPLFLKQGVVFVEG